MAEEGLVRFFENELGWERAGLEAVIGKKLTRGEEEWICSRISENPSLNYQWIWCEKHGARPLGES